MFAEEILLMICCIISGFSVVCFAVVGFFDWSAGYRVGKICILAVIISVLVMLSSIVGWVAFVNWCVGEDSDQGENIELFSLADSVGVGGTFVLGTGSTEQEEYYTFYVENERGNKVIDHREARKSEIDDSLEVGAKPYLETVRRYCGDRRGNAIRYVFHVPKGTIVNYYVLDSN